jgi:DDE superfamily endonuclease
MIGRHRKPRSNIAKALAFILTIRIEYGVIASAARTYNVRPRALGMAWSTLCKVLDTHSLRSNDREVIRALHLTEPRGASSHRLLTDEQEELVVHQLRTKYLSGFNDDIIVQICRDIVHDLRDHPRLYSTRFLTAFKKRSGIRLSKLHIHQVTAGYSEQQFKADMKQRETYIAKVHELSNSIPPHLIINVDECPSYVRNLPTRALHFTDSPPPWFFVRAKERDCVTTIGAVVGNGRVLKTSVISKGMTSRCEDQFRRELPHSFIQHTPSCLTNSESFIEYLEHVILPYTNSQRAVLIADAYKAHKTDEVKTWCANHSISLVIVPDRATAVMQPLDVSVFGMAKLGMYRDIARKLFLVERDEKSRWEATAECVRAINRVSVAGGLRGWKDVFPFWSDYLKRHKLE